MSDHTREAESLRSENAGLRQIVRLIEFWVTGSKLAQLESAIQLKNAMLDRLRGNLCRECGCEKCFEDCLWLKARRAWFDGS